MVRIVIANAFSVNMITNREVLLFKRITLQDAKTLLQKALESNINILSIVGHEATAQLLTKLLNVPVPVNRVNYVYSRDDLMLVFTISVRLPEGKVLSNEEIAQYLDKINVTLVVPTVEFVAGNIGFPARIDDRPDLMLQLLKEVDE